MSFENKTFKTKNFLTLSYKLHVLRPDFVHLCLIKINKYFFFKTMYQHWVLFPLTAKALEWKVKTIPQYFCTIDCCDWITFLISRYWVWPWINGWLHGGTCKQSATLTFCWRTIGIGYRSFHWSRRCCVT